MKQHILLIATLAAFLAATLQARAQQSSVLLSEDFQSTSGIALPAGWDNATTDAAGAVYNWKTNTGGYYPAGGSASGQRCAYLYAPNAYVTYAALKTPTVTLPTGRDALLRFRLKNNSTGGDLDVYVSTDGGQTYTANPVVTGLATPSADWAEYEYIITGFSGRQISFVFLAHSSGSTTAYYYNIDDVAVELAPTCQPPSGIYLSGLAETAVNMAWGLKGAGYGAVPDSTDIELSTAGDSVVLATTLPGVRSYAFTGLEPGTAYRARVRSNCTAGYRGRSDWTEAAFTTRAMPRPLPYAEDFNTLTGLPDGTYSLNASLNTSTTYAYGGSGRSLKLSTTATDIAYIVLPPLSAAINGVEVDFRIRRASASYQMRYQVGYVTDPADIASSYTMLYADTLVAGTAWQNVRFNTGALADTTGPVMIMIMAEDGFASQIYVDNIDIHALPSCVRPEQVTVRNVTAHTACISWTMTNAPAVLITATGDSSVVTATATQSPYTLTGLAEATEYSITLRGICAASDSSETTEPVVITTLCDVADAPFITENFDATASGRAPDCWSMGWINLGSSTATAPFSTSTGYKHGGSGKSMSLARQAVGTCSYLSTRALPLTPAGGYDVRLWVYRVSAASYPDERIEIWATPAADDTTGGTRLGIIPRHYLSAPAEDAANTWYQYQFNIPAGGTQYIMVVGESQNGSGLYFDDFEVIEAPTCRLVGKPAIEAITTTSATMSWTPGGAESAWVVDYTVSTVGGSLSGSVTVTEPTVTLAGLTPATVYTASGTVRALCSGTDTAEARTFSFDFVTQCNALDSLPYTCGFEAEDDGVTGTNPFSRCWTRFNDATTSTNAHYPYNYTAASSYPAHSGNRFLYHYLGSASGYADHAAAVLPQVDTSVYPINGLRLSFWAANCYANGSSYCDVTIVVGVMSNPADIATFTPVDTIVIPTSHQAKLYEQYCVLLSSYTGAGAYVAICFPKPAAKYNYVLLDDVVLDAIPTCLETEIGSLRVTGADESSITVTMTDSTASRSWELAYGLRGTPVGSMTVVAAADSVYTITGLASASEYSLLARRRCSATDVSAWSDIVDARTTAVPAEMPYRCGFEGLEENGQWQFADAVTSATTANNFVIGTMDSAVHTGAHALYVSSNGGQTYNYVNNASSKSFAYRTLRMESKVYTVVFSWKAPGGEDGYDFGRAMLVPASSAIEGGAGLGITNAGFVWPAGAIYLDAGDAKFANRLNQSPAAATAGWHRYEATLDMRGRAGIYNLAFMWNNDGSGGSGYPLAIDDIDISELRCTAPATVSIARLTYDTVTLAYPQASAHGFELLMDSLPVTIDRLPDAPLYRGIDTLGTATIGGLEPNRQYYYAVRAICGEGDTSAWTRPATLRTACRPYSLPYEESFEAESSVQCWQMMQGDETGAVERNTLYHRTGGASMRVAATTAVSPEFIVDSLTRYQLSGYVYSTVDNVRIAAGLIVDPADISTFETFGNILVTRSGVWHSFCVYFTDLADPDYADFRAARNIVLSTGLNTVYFDDLRLELTPSCPQPTETAIDQVSDTSFRLSFIDNAQATAYAIRLNGTHRIVTNSNPSIVTGLNPNTTYAVEVAAICSAADTSRYTDAGSVTTACRALALPYVCGFEPEEGFVRGNSNALTHTLQPACWETINEHGNGSATYPYLYPNTAYALHGQQGLYMYHSSSGSPLSLYAVMPELAARADSLTISFSYKSTGTPIVGYVTDATADSTFVPLDTLATSTTWRSYAVRTDVVPGLPATARFAICLKQPVATGSTAVYHYIGVDDIVINRISACPAPDNVETVSTTATTAVIAYSDNDTAQTGAEYVYGLRGVDPDDLTPQTVTGDTIRLTGLEPDTDYELFVRRHCGSQAGLWAKALFRTGCAPYVVTETTPFYDSFEDLENNQRMVNCNEAFGVSGTYFPKGTANTYSLTAATPSWTRNAHTGEMALQIISTPASSDGQGSGFYRALHLTDGRIYRISLFARALTYPAIARLLVGPERDLNTMELLAEQRINQTTAYTIPAHDDEIKCVDYCHSDQQVAQYFSVPETGDYYIAVHSDFVEGQTTSRLYVDDLTVEEMTGCTPSPVTVDSVEGSVPYCTIKLYRQGDSYEYTITNRVSGDTLVGWTAAEGRSFAVAGLPGSTRCNIALRQVCGTERSAQSDADFDTECTPYVITAATPFYDSFEDGTAHNVAYDGMCYEKEGENATYFIKSYGPGQSTHFPHTGHTCLYMLSYRSQAPNGMSIGRRFRLAAGTAYEVSVYARTTSYVTHLTMNCTDAAGERTVIGDFQVQPCTAIAGDFAHCWQLYKTVFTASATGDYLISINSACVGLNSTVYTCIDDFRVREQPTCPDPDGAPTVNSTTVHTASVTLPTAGRGGAAQIGWARSSANPTTADIAHTMATTAADAVLTGLDSLAAYNVWYRVICADGDTSIWSEAAELRTKATDCFEPENIRLVGTVGDRRADITWGRAPLATGYEYILRSGDDTVARGTTAADTLVLDSLAPNTDYELTLWAHCSGTATAQQLFGFRTTTTPVDVPYVSGFENPAEDVNWNIRNLTRGTNYLTIGSASAAVKDGLRSLYQTNNGVAYDYVAGLSGASAEVILRMPRGSYSISYDWKHKGTALTDYARVVLLPTSRELTADYLTSAKLHQSLPEGAIAIDGGVKLNLQESWQRYDDRIRVEHDGFYRLIVAVVTDATGVDLPAFAIDNISVLPIVCDAPSAVSISHVEQTTATARVTRNADHAPYEYGVTAEQSVDSVAQWTAVTDSAAADTIALTGLRPGTTYTLYVRSVCDSIEKSEPVATEFFTRAEPRELPYVCGFETDSDRTGWALTRGTADNRWTIGTGTAASGRGSLYVTDDGEAYNYNGDLGSISRYSWSYAYIPLRMEQAAYEIDYDWVANGEGSADYMRLFLLPDTFHILDNVQLLGLNATALPAGAVALDGGSKLNLAEEWQHASLGFNAPERGVYYLVALWRNDGTRTVLPAGAFDNFNVRLAACPTFATGHGRMTYNATDTTIDLRVRGNLPASSIGYHVSTTGLYTDTVALDRTAPGDSMIHLVGLTPATRYYARIWGVCDSGLTTTAPVSVFMRTTCGTVHVYPYRQGFEAYSAGSAYRTELSDNCWLTSSSSDDAYYYISTGTYAYDGQKGLYIYNYTQPTTQTFALPEMADLGGKHLSFVYKHYTTTSCDLQLGYLADRDDISSFVPLDVAPRSTDWAEYEADLPAVLPDTMRPAFRTVGTHYLYIDNIRISARVAGPEVHDTVCYGSGYSRYGLRIPAGRLLVGDTTIVHATLSDEPGVADTLCTIHIHTRAEILNEVYDTACAGQPYRRGRWDIADPQSTVYFSTFTTPAGCDSTVTLHLAVLPAARTVVDTICEGDVYQTADTAFTRAGIYTFTAENAAGCTETVTLHLAVVDSLVTTDRTICGGEVCRFEGSDYTRAGVYRVSAAIHGCTQARELRLTVLPADSTINVTICSGGQAQVVDTFITTAGSYDLVRVTAEGCDITYHIHCTVTPPREGHYTDDACEGRPYSGYGIQGAILTGDTVFTVASRAADLCDSLTVVSVAFHPTQYGDTAATIRRGETFTWQDNTYTEAGDYTATLHDLHGCDSVATLHLSVIDGIDNASACPGRIRVVPNPARAGEAALVIVSGTGEIARVEVINSYGAVVSAVEPRSTPVDLAAPTVAGVYHVRVITREGRVYVEKLVVK